MVLLNIYYRNAGKKPQKKLDNINKNTSQLYISSTTGCSDHLSAKSLNIGFTIPWNIRG